MVIPEGDEEVYAKYLDLDSLAPSTAKVGKSLRLLYLSSKPA